MKRPVFFLRAKTRPQKPVRISRLVQPERVVKPMPKQKIVHPKNRVDVDPREILARFR